MVQLFLKIINKIFLEENQKPNKIKQKSKEIK